MFSAGRSATIPVTVAAGGLVGLFNGILIGFLRLRAFLTTLVTLIIVRAVVDMLLLKYRGAMSTGFVDSVLGFARLGTVWACRPASCC